MTPLLAAWLISGSVITFGLAVGYLLRRVLDQRAPRPADAECPDPRELLALVRALDATEWHVCASTACARLSTPHRRDVAEYATCLWCGHITTEVAHG